MANKKLVNYIKKTLMKGYHIQQIRVTLTKEGYKEKDIESAISEVSKKHKINPSFIQTLGKFNLILAVLAVITLYFVLGKLFNLTLTFIITVSLISTVIHYFKAGRKDFFGLLMVIIVEMIYIIIIGVTALISFIYLVLPFFSPIHVFYMNILLFPFILGSIIFAVHLNTHLTQKHLVNLEKLTFKHTLKHSIVAFIIIFILSQIAIAGYGVAANRRLTIRSIDQSQIGDLVFEEGAGNLEISQEINSRYSTIKEKLLYPNIKKPEGILEEINFFISGDMYKVMNTGTKKYITKYYHQRLINNIINLEYNEIKLNKRDNIFSDNTNNINEHIDKLQINIDKLYEKVKTKSPKKSEEGLAGVVPMLTEQALTGVFFIDEMITHTLIYDTLLKIQESIKEQYSQDKDLEIIDEEMSNRYIKESPESKAVRLRMIFYLLKEEYCPNNVDRSNCLIELVKIIEDSYICETSKSKEYVIYDNNCILEFVKLTNNKYFCNKISNSQLKQECEAI